MESNGQIIATFVIPVVLLVLNVALTALVGLGMYLLRDFRAGLREKFAEQDRKIEDVRDDLSEFKAALPQKYVLRDDFIRTMAVLDAKLDKIGDAVYQMIRRDS